MRDFIRIITESQTLMEGKEYLAMFTALDNVLARYDDDIGRYPIQDLEKYKGLCAELKRQDRQTWAARLLRFVFVRSLIQSLEENSMPALDLENGTAKTGQPENANLLSELRRIGKKFHDDLIRVNGEHVIVTNNAVVNFIRRDLLHHFLGIPYTKIQSYTFSNQNLHKVLTDLRALEAEFKERKRGLLALEEGDEIILKLPGDFVWVMLSRGYCDREAKAMGHCGNAGARDGDRILSLRRKKDSIEGVDYYEVFLTFILNGDGKLGEMKGRGNDKPAQRYHDQIIALLKLPIIKGIRGGGYMPKNNFSLDDLTSEQLDELLTGHSHLANLSARLRKEGVSEELNREIGGGLYNAIDVGQTINITPEGNFIIYTWGDIDDFVEEMSNDDHTKEVAKSDYQYEVYDGISNDDVGNFYTDLPVYMQIAIWDHVREQVVADGGEEAGEEFDELRTSEIVEKIEEFDPPLHEALFTAVMYGRESGAQGEAHELLVKAIKQFNPVVGTLVMSTYEEEDGTKGWRWDEPVRLELSVEEAAKIADASSEDENEYENIESFFGDDKLEIDQPYYGYSDFDDAYALETFRDHADLKFVRPEKKPDFAEMSEEDAKKVLENLYEKAQEGFVYKRPLDQIGDFKVAASNFWDQYWGKA